MKKTNFVASLLLAITSLSLTTSFIVASSCNSFVYAEIKTTVVNAEDYYSSISDNMTGNDLLGALNTLNNTKKKKTIGYAGLRDTFKYFDADPNGSGKIVGFYDNALVGPSWDGGSTWNREHVWPNVRGGSSVEGDAHMTRPTSTKTNSDRGSKGYGTTSYDPGQFVEYYRGAASRIIFYAAIADTNLKLVDDPLNYNGGTPANSMGSLSEMLKWNLQYQPSDTSFTGADDIARRTEINRNNAIEDLTHGQGNRNPFIDHPEYACRIWGNTNAQTRAICGSSGGSGESGGDNPGGGSAGTDYELENIALNYSERTLSAGETLQLSVTYIPENTTDTPEVIWLSNNASIASVDSNGLVTGLKNGTAKISAVVEEKNLIASCTVTVVGGVVQESSNGCGGNIVFTSLLLSVLSLIGISLILIKRFTYVFDR